MHKYMQTACRTLAGAMIVAILAMATYPATAQPVYVDGTLTIAAGATSATADIAITATAITIDRIVVANYGAVTTGVSFVANDLGVLTPLDAFALGATTALSQYPPGRSLVSYQQACVVTGDVMVVRDLASTNTVPIPVRDIRLTAAKATNATDVVIQYRIFGTAQ